MHKSSKTISKEEADEVKRRLEEYYRHYLHISTRRFEKNMGKATGYIRNFTGNMRPENRAILEEVYPALNLDYVFNGTGSIIKSGYEERAMEIHPIGERAKVSKIQNIDSPGSIVGYDINTTDDGHITIAKVLEMLNSKDEQIKQKDDIIEKLLDKIMRMTEALSKTC